MHCGGYSSQTILELPKYLGLARYVVELNAREGLSSYEKLSFPPKLGRDLLGQL